MSEVETLKHALRGLLDAVTFKGPPVDFGGAEPNPCYEARVPVGFVDAALDALGLPRVPVGENAHLPGEYREKLDAGVAGAIARIGGDDKRLGAAQYVRDD